MSDEDLTYHQERVEQCRSMAQKANDPEIRRRHEQLASLHAQIASRPTASQQ
jgi:hypothetical protein